MRKWLLTCLWLALASPTWATEQFANAIAPATSCTSSIATTTLAANLNGTDATDNIALASPPWPSSGTFSIQIDNEIITVNSCANSVCNATRNESGGEASHTAGAYICGPLITQRMWNQLKTDLSYTPIGFSISGSPSASQIFPVQCPFNLTLPANFAGAAPYFQATASCGTAPSVTNTYNVSIGPNTPAITNAYGGVATTAITFTGLTISAGQSVVVVQKGTGTSSVGTISDGTNTYTQSPITTDGCLWLSTALRPTAGTYTLTIGVPPGGANNGAAVFLVTNLSGVDTTGGVAYGNTPAGLAQTGTVTPRTVNEVLAGVYYLEATTPSFSGTNTNYTGTGSPAAVALGTLGTSLNNGSIALAATQEAGMTASSAGIQQGYTGITPNYCGANIALLGQQVNVGSVTLTPTCVPTFTTGGPTATCNAGQRLELDAPAAPSGANIAITLPAIGHP